MNEKRKSDIGSLFKLVRPGATLKCYLIIFPMLVMLIVFTFIPVLWAFAGSLFQYEVGGGSTFIGLGNYTEYLFHDPTTWPSFGVMLVFTGAGVLISLTIPLILAKLIYSIPNERWRYFYRLVFLIPIVVPGTAVLLLWSGMIYSDSGLLNQLLKAAGLETWIRGWLSNPHTVVGAIIFIGFPWASGINILIYYAGLMSISMDVNEAALIEGCTGIRKFFLIDVPLVMSQLKLLLILGIIGGIQGFGNLIILTMGGPGFKSMVPGLWMYLNAFSFQRMGYACAIGVVLFVIILGLTILNLKYFKSTEEMKGGNAR